MGLINLRYQTGAEANLSKSSVLIIVGALTLLLTFISQLTNFFMKKTVKLLALALLVVFIAYGILI